MMPRMKTMYFFALWLVACQAPSEPALEARFSAVEVNGQPVPGLMYVRDEDWKITLLVESLNLQKNGQYTRTVRTRYDTRDSVYVKEVVDFGSYRLKGSTIALRSEKGVGFDALLEFQRPETIRHRYDLLSATVILRRD